MGHTMTSAIGGILTAIFLTLVTAAYAQENAGCMECNTTIWQLRLMPDNVTISFGDLDSEAECLALKAELEAQADEPFTELVCKEIWVVRYKI